METTLSVLGLFSFLVILGTAVTIALLTGRLRRAQADAGTARAESHALRDRIEILGREVQVLAKYRPILDVEAYLVQTRSQTEQYVARMNSEAQGVMQGAHASAAAVQAQAAQQASAIIEKANADYRQAQADAWAIHAQATQHASAIADNAKAEAEQARQSLAQDTAETHRLRAVISALKDVINGYGTQYVLPTAGLLDELAEEFGFDDAGKRLKEARDASRSMIKNGNAGACDYVEASRAATAIAFVVDAFNGKVDTILADIRHDNFGTLRKKIHDAFHLVNQNGVAFRNARITPEYLQSRLLELKWGAMAQELKLKQKEEQRRLKDQMREEERAQREFERARKEALKEEEAISKALDRVRKEMEKAGEAQREKYELQMQELKERLRLAEEKNQRAISMAQQTRAGHVYIISNVGSFGEDVFKIGMTRRLEPLDRVQELGDASVPFEFDVHAMISHSDAPALETSLHRTFVRKQVNKVNARKEFFKVSLSEIRAEVERLGIPATWTIEAACRQYLETLAIERAIAANEFDVQAWAQAQLREHDRVVTQQVTSELDEDSAA